MKPATAADTTLTAPDTLAPLRPRGSNNGGLRQYNERVVLHAIRVHGSLPKADIARLTGLTAQTIGLITTRLEDEGLLLKQERVRGRIGQPSVPLALHPDGAYAIGIKVGRRRTESLLVDFTGQERARYTLSYDFPDLAKLRPTIAQHLAQFTEQLGPLATRLVGVGVVAPFQLGGWHRMLGLSPEQADAWNHIDLGAEIQNLTALPVSFSRDTLAACVAELVNGRGHDLKNFLYLYVDTFVGGGLVLNSQLHAGAHGNAGAVASLPLQAARPGNLPPQLISQASLWELEQLLRRDQLDPSAAYDERALQAPYAACTARWLDEAAWALAHCIVSGTAMLDLQDVVLDGSIDRALLQQLLERTEAVLPQCNWEGLWPPRLHAGRIGPHACALGGALLPLHANFAMDSDVFLKSA